MPRHYALLIGIDLYLPNNINGGEYPSLKGCVRDIGQIEQFLTTRIGVKPEDIVKLTSTKGAGRAQPQEPAERRPSYENIVDALKKLTERAEKDDLVYVQYSGHGGRTKTSLPEKKGAQARDESLVPFDIGDSAARYIRDHELALVFKRMADKGIIATFVMDCCHSGGLTRGLDVGVRGVEFVDETKRNTESLVGSHDDLAQCWASTMGADGTRSLVTTTQKPGYTLLAACRPSELAKEFAFDGQTRMGALTYWMLDTLQQAEGKSSWKLIHDRVCAKVHSQFPDQTPMLLGDPSREAFGSNQVSPVFAIRVEKASADQQSVTLASGQAAGLRPGSQFAIYPRGTIDFSSVEKRLALVEAIDVGAVQTQAKVIQRFGDRAIDDGDQAVLLTLPVKLIKKVQFLPFSDATTARDEPTLQKIRDRLSGNGWIEAASTAEPAQFKVVIDEAGESILICQPDGETPFQLRPVVKVGDPEAPAKIVKRLQHLARYEAVRSLDNFSSVSPLRGKIQIELLILPDDFDEALDDPGKVGKLLSGPVYGLKVGQKACLRISNLSANRLNVAILDLQPDWGITQVYPAEDFEPLEQGTPILLPIGATLTEGIDHGIDVLKVFATLGTTSFRSLELPALDQPVTAARSTRSASDGVLEQLLSEFGKLQPRTRQINVSGAPREWTTTQAEILVERRG